MIKSTFLVRKTKGQGFRIWATPWWHAFAAMTPEEQLAAAERRVLDERKYLTIKDNPE